MLRLILAFCRGRASPRSPADRRDLFGEARQSRPSERFIARDIVWNCGAAACQGATTKSRPVGAVPVARQARRPSRQLHLSTAARSRRPSWSAAMRPPSALPIPRSPPNKRPRGAAILLPLGGGPTLLSRLHKSVASPHLRRVLRQYELVEKVRSYDPDADEGLINRAYVFSMKAHGSQMRASGDPYFSHPIEVAGILTDLKLDDQTIATAILHDTIEDTLATPEEIEQIVRHGRRPAGRRRDQAQQDRGAVGK